MDYKGWVCLAETTVKVKVPDTKIDLKGQGLQGLEKERDQMQARHFVEMKDVEDRIANLLAIEYKPDSRALSICESCGIKAKCSYYEHDDVMLCDDCLEEEQAK